MFALVYIAACLVLGRLILSKAVGSPVSWWSRMRVVADNPLVYSGSLPAQLAAWSGGLWIGLISVTWLVYFLAYILNQMFSANGLHPLFFANLIALTIVMFCIWLLIRQGHKKPNRKSHDWKHIENQTTTGLSDFFHQLIDPKERRSNLFILLILIILISFSVWLMYSTFYIKQGNLAAGYSIFSDFAPHTALISSFVEGRNWPTQYPHFAGDGISYHFMFYFLCGNLAYLGLPLDSAINLPSTLGMISFFILLGSLTLLLTGRLAAWGMVMLLTLARSSMAAFTYLGELFRSYGLDLHAWLARIKYQRVFIGNTSRDDWGLWTINVYANQRHLLPALSIMVLVIMLFLPAIRRKPATTHIHGLSALKECWFGPGSWLPDNSQRQFIPDFLLATALLVMLPYWHGSSLIATLLILSVLAITSRSRLLFLLAVIISVISATLQVWFFSNGVDKIVQPKILIGFIAKHNNLTGILIYLAEMMGLALPLFLLLFLLPGRLRKITLLAALTPLVFAFIVSLTPDVTVNHKYIMISIMLCNIWLADFVLMLWQQAKIRLSTANDSIKKRLVSRDLTRLLLTILRRCLLALMVLILILTGLLEWRIFNNINQMVYQIKLQTPTLIWIKKNTEPQSIFLTAPYHYNSFYLSGRGTWLGHSYYAWSAGHDTAKRLEQEQWLLSGADGNALLAADFVRLNNIDYILIDDTLRKHDQFNINENFFSVNFQLVAEFPDDNNTKIYNTKRRIS